MDQVTLALVEQTSLVKDLTRTVEKQTKLIEKLHQENLALKAKLKRVKLK